MPVSLQFTSIMLLGVCWMEFEGFGIEMSIGVDGWGTWRLDDMG